jgi:hypothetical protein
MLSLVSKDHMHNSIYVKYPEQANQERKEVEQPGITANGHREYFWVMKVL